MRHRPSSLYNTDHYREDPLRDSSDFRWHSMNPALRDMAFMDGSFITQHHHILLLTLEEAQQVIDDLMGGVDRFFSYRAGPGNIKDGLDAFRSLTKLTTWYNPAKELMFNFDVLKIKAIEYKVGGKTYIKITGYPGLRRILTGTRYGANHPQILEMAIGKQGLYHNIRNGVRYCIYFSLAWRAIELIFKSDYNLTDFLVDITMDMAKAVVSGVLIGLVAGVLALMSLPIIVTTGFIIAIGIGLNIGLNILDDKLGLSNELKGKVRDYTLHHIKSCNYEFPSPDSHLY
ncbi:hypothetical protein [Citrobacter sp. 50677481]|uniref:hypothetical protein n=1 Tax=Citrobacter sp. 50677481 TaxID=1736699 RepID=UPI000741DAFA|nr:hypothetical protein [Citrobacter sp. 50677481]KSY24404.1 hypothetical protein APU02_21095 [Citrobacter sp. 50677481]HCQ7756038.1 hypothetical protein [Citrobacter sedlakii]